MYLLLCLTRCYSATKTKRAQIFPPYSVWIIPLGVMPAENTCSFPPCVLFEQALTFSHFYRRITFSKLLKWFNISFIPHPDPAVDSASLSYTAKGEIKCSIKLSTTFLKTTYIGEYCQIGTALNLCTHWPILTPYTLHSHTLPTQFPTAVYTHPHNKFHWVSGRKPLLLLLCKLCHFLRLNMYILYSNDNPRAGLGDIYVLE